MKTKSISLRGILIDHADIDMDTRYSVLPEEEYRRMVSALTKIAEQKTLVELENMDRRFGDFEAAYDLCVKTARVALDKILT